MVGWGRASNVRLALGVAIGAMSVANVLPALAAESTLAAEPAVEAERDGVSDGSRAVRPGTGGHDGDETGQDIVVSATGFEIKIAEAPASISVVTAEVLAERPYMTLIDAVRDLEGVDVGETSDKTGQRTISIRGMGADYTLLLINGKRQNNHGDIYPNSFGGNAFNHIPPLDTVERIEVIRGPASTLYGADAMGGVINIITRAVNERWSGSATVGRSFQEDSRFGTDITFDAGISGPILGDTLGLSLRGSIYERMASNPEFAPVVDPSGVTQVRALGFGGGGRTVDNTNYNVGGTLSWQPAVGHTVEIDYDISRQIYDNTPITDPQTGTVTFPLGTLDSIDTIWQVRGGIVAPRVGYKDKQSFNRTNWSITHNGEWSFGRSFVSLAYIDTVNRGRTRPFSVAERLLLQEIYDGTGDYAGLSESERRSIAEDTFLPRPDRDLSSSQYTFDARMVVPLRDLAGDHGLVVGGQYIDGELFDAVFGLEESAEGLSAVQKQQQWSVFAEDNWSVEASEMQQGANGEPNRRSSYRCAGVHARLMVRDPVAGDRRESEDCAHARPVLLPPGTKPPLLAPLPARIVTQLDVFESKAWLSWKS